MAATKTAPKKPTTTKKPVSNGALKAVGEIEVSLDKTRIALTRMHNDLGRDGKRIANDVEKLVRTAQRDVVKLSRAIRSDIGR